MSKRTSLISVYLLSTLVVCTLALSSAGEQENVQNSEKSNLFQRIKRQFGRENFNGGFDGGFGDGFGRGFDGGFGRGRRQGPGGFFFQNNGNDFPVRRPLNSGNNELIFSVNPRQNPDPLNADSGNAMDTATPQPFFPPQNGNNNNMNPTSNNNNNNNNNNNGGANQSGQLVFINNMPTIATMAPFTGRTTASPQYLTCFNSCRTTSEYNPICGSDQELYFNEQKFNCAVGCGANIQIVRRGSCQGLFPMERG